MGGYNQAYFLARQVGKHDNLGRVAEVGSKNYGNTIPFRKYFSHDEWVGIDLEEGNGVDVVQDIQKSTDGLGLFDTVICVSTLEHTPTPWILAKAIEDITRRGGSIYVSVPWVWRYHPYPDDYFRFSHSGLKSLFQNVRWLELVYSSTKEAEFLDPSVNTTMDGRMYSPYMEVHGWGVRD